MYCMSPTETPGFFITASSGRRLGSDQGNLVLWRLYQQNMPGTGLNIIVCVDPRRCLALNYRGRNSLELLQEIEDRVSGLGLANQVKATPCQCIFGCTYGPRIDVINRSTGEKSLYGAIGGPVTISVRGRVEMKQIPDDLQDLIQDHLD